ncbi:MAG: AAA family ATPase, partial [SAR324 cluster bacterium]|nr:AAA family ATPase [SAR324 cluster bacterium]
MECGNCGHDNRPVAKFCEECGSPLERSCPACQQALSPSAKYCDFCGHDLSKPIAATPPPAAAPSPEGERRQATVLFCDLSGYTAMNEQLDPEEVEGVMSRIKTEAVKIVESHGGIVNQFVGDEVLALFGIPTAHEDDPRRAVQAALELHELVRGLSGRVEGRIGRPLRMHTGINTGLIVTHLRDDRDGRYGITGDAVITGARLKAQAEADEILVGAETEKLIAPFFETEALAAVAMKGKAKAAIPYRVVRASEVQTRFEAAEQRGFTPFTGREQELATLHACLARAVGGQGQFVTVLGEAGVGKSRLLFEFRHGLDREQITVLQGRCQSYGSETPYLPFLDAIRRGLRLREEENPDALLNTAVTNIRAIDAALEQYIPHYLHLLSIPNDDFPLPDGLQGEALRSALLEALAAMFTLNTRDKPMVCIMEDWHWADEASDAAMKNLMGLIAHYPLMMVVIYRPEFARSWGNPEQYTPIVVKSLDVANTETLIRSVFDAAALPEGLGARVHERTGGNPLFIEEIGHALIEEGTVVVKAGQAALTEALDSVRLPDTVHAVIRARVDRLDGEAREVLRVAAVIGREFARRILERVYPARARLPRPLEDLRAQDLIQQVRVLPEAQYIFKHVLTQVVVYETLLLQQRKTLHAMVGHAIEALYPDRLEEYYEDLAHHYRQSAETEKAIEYLGKSGDKAVGYSSLREARSHYQAAVELLDSLNEREAYVDDRIRITLRWAEIGTGLVTEDLAAALAEAFACAQLLDQQAQMLEVASWEAHIRMMLGDAVRGRELAEYVVSSPDSSLGEAATGRAYTCLGINALWSGEVSSAVNYTGLGRQSLGRGMGPFWERWLLMLSGRSGAFSGEFDSSLHWFEKAIEISSEERSMESWAPVFAGYAYNEQAAWARASSAAALGRELAQRYDDPWPAAWGL